MIIYTVKVNNIIVKTFAHKKDVFNYIKQYDDKTKITIWKEEYYDDENCYETHGYKDIIYSIN